MARVINVEEVLKHALYKGDGELYIRIQDTIIKENNKVFQIIYKDNKAVEVFPLSDSRLSGLRTAEQDALTTLDSEEKVDIEMTINQFSAAILGNYDVSDIDYLEGITLYCSKEKASGLIFKKPCWINNFF